MSIKRLYHRRQALPFSGLASEAHINNKTRIPVATVPSHAALLTLRRRPQQPRMARARVPYHRRPLLPLPPRHHPDRSIQRQALRRRDSAVHGAIIVVHALRPHIAAPRRAVPARHPEGHDHLRGTGVRRHGGRRARTSAHGMVARFLPEGRGRGGLRYRSAGQGVDG